MYVNVSHNKAEGTGIHRRANAGRDKNVEWHNWYECCMNAQWEYTDRIYRMNHNRIQAHKGVRGTGGMLCGETLAWYGK